jgi:hypothetical protein
MVKDRDLFQALRRSTIKRDGELVVLTLNGVFDSRPIAHVSTASKSPVRTTSFTTVAPGSRFGPL